MRLPRLPPDGQSLCGAWSPKQHHHALRTSIHLHHDGQEHVVDADEESADIGCSSAPYPVLPAEAIGRVPVLIRGWARQGAC